jgi:hypothetical protein
VGKRGSGGRASILSFHESALFERLKPPNPFGHERSASSQLVSQPLKRVNGNGIDFRLCFASHYLHFQSASFHVALA